MVTSNVVASEDEMRVLQVALLDRLPQKGVLFTPSQSFYEQLTTSDGIRNAARELYRWLGVKPYRLRAVIAQTDDITYLSGTLTVPTALVRAPYLLAACLAMRIVRQVLCDRLETSPDTSVVERASVEAGLGIIVLNGIAQQTQHHSVLHAAFSTHHPLFLALEGCTPRQYGLAVAAYVHTYRLDSGTLMAHLSQPAQTLMPPYTRHYARAARPDPTIMVAHRARLSSLAYRWLAGSVAIASSLTLGLFIWAQRPYRAPATTQEQYQKVALLRQQYDACVQTAKKNRSAASLDDFYADQAINSTLARCQSLRNQYNYETGVYNQMVDVQ